MNSLSRIVITIVASQVVVTLPVRAQASLDGLLRDLQELKATREKEMMAGIQVLIGRLNTASTNPEEARTLLRECGYMPPDENENGKPKRNRQAPQNLAQKQAQDREAGESEALDLVLTKHCSFLYAAIYSTTLKDNERQNFLRSWILTMVPEYGSYRGNDLAKVKGPESVVAKKYGIGYLFENSEIGKGSLRSIPGLYKTLILEPLRSPLKPDALPAWDNFLALKDVDASENREAQLIEVPELRFQRTQDNFLLSPTEGAIAAQIDFLRNNREHPKFNEFVQKVESNIAQLRSGKTGT